jgi:hypothetical protein
VTTAPGATGKSIPARLPLRFSLRVLLLAVTVFAIGFPIWYRWPYEEEDPDAAKSNQNTKRVITWQRQWGGGRLKHGPESTYRKGELIHRATYKNGILHGPFEARMPRGVRESGQYIDGKKGGEWRWVDKEGKLRRSANWREDRLDGPFLMVDPKGRERHLTFERGRLVKAEGRNVEEQLSELLASGAIDQPRIAQALTSPTSLEFIDIQLRGATDFIAAQHEIPAVLDPHCVDPNKPIDADWQGLELWCALAIIGSENDLGFAYRYGLLWITTAEDAKDWHDPTGVSDIVPPKDSSLAKAWSEPVSFDAIEKPLADVLAQIVERLDIRMDTSQIAAGSNGKQEFLVTKSLRGLEFRHVLGMLLYQTRCRCKLEGETLVILPPEK